MIFLWNTTHFHFFVIQYTDNKKNIHKGDQNHEQEKNYGHPGRRCIQRSFCKSHSSYGWQRYRTDNRNRGNVLCGRRQHRWADDRFRGRHPLTENRESFRDGHVLRGNPRLSFYGTLCRASRWAEKADGQRRCGSAHGRGLDRRFRQHQICPPFLEQAHRWAERGGSQYAGHRL